VAFEAPFEGWIGQFIFLNKLFNVNVAFVLGARWEGGLFHYFKFK